MAHDFDISDYTSDKVRNDINYLSYYSKNRDAVAADKTGKGTKSFILLIKIRAEKSTLNFAMVLVFQRFNV